MSQLLFKRTVVAAVGSAVVLCAAAVLLKRAGRPPRAKHRESAAGCESEEHAWPLISRVASRARISQLLDRLAQPWVRASALLSRRCFWALVRATEAGCFYAVSLGLGVGGTARVLRLHEQYVGLFGQMILRSMLQTPNGAATLRILPPDVTSGNSHWKHLLAMRVGNLKGARRHTLRLSLKNTPSSGWDSLLQKSRNSARRRLGVDEGTSENFDTKVRASDNTSATSQTASRHTRVASGLSWRCDLCGERVKFIEEECPYCCNARPSLDKIPRKGDREIIGSPWLRSIIQNWITLSCAKFATVCCIVIIPFRKIQILPHHHHNNECPIL